MNPDGAMTSRRLVRAFFRDAPCPRPPLLPLAFYHAARLDGSPPNLLLQDPTRLTRALADQQRLLGADCVTLRFDAALLAELAGMPVQLVPSRTRRTVGSGGGMRMAAAGPVAAPSRLQPAGSHPQIANSTAKGSADPGRSPRTRFAVPPGARRLAGEGGEDDWPGARPGRRGVPGRGRGGGPGGGGGGGGRKNPDRGNHGRDGVHLQHGAVLQRLFGIVRLPKSRAERGRRPCCFIPRSGRIAFRRIYERGFLRPRPPSRAPKGQPNSFRRWRRRPGPSSSRPTMTRCSPIR